MALVRRGEAGGWSSGIAALVVAVVACAAAIPGLGGCSGAGDASVANGVGGGGGGATGSGSATGSSSSSDGQGSPSAASTATADAGPPPPACPGGTLTDTLAKCIDQGGAPNACLAKAKAAPSAATRCVPDADHDGMDDDLEDALARSYAPAFAYNRGDGTHAAGSDESVWPANVTHFASHASLVWRVGGDASTADTLAAHPALDDLARATHTDAAQQIAHASSPATGEGPNFWLCLDTASGGGYAPDVIVSTEDASRALPGGVELYTVVHPTNGPRTGGQYAFVGYMLFYAYNQFSLDDHEGDWEGGAVFVDLDAGSVAALLTERHATSDGELLVPLVGPGAVPVKSAATESPKYDVCSATDAASVMGVRFWDDAGPRHHPILYVSSGDHGSYAYPGATKIQGVGCNELTIVRDVHNGQGAKLLPWAGGYATSFPGAGSSTPPATAPVANGVHVINVGESGDGATSLRAGWSAFAGQWGCSAGSVGGLARSYPGPWDNAALCRHWMTETWNASPPFAAPDTSASCAVP